jgi:hypothetical protein
MHTLPTNITCVDFYKEPFVLILVVQIKFGVQDDSLQPTESYVIVRPFYPRRWAVSSLLRDVVCGFGNDPVILDVVTELLATSEECSDRLPFPCPGFVYELPTIHLLGEVRS